MTETLFSSGSVASVCKMEELIEAVRSEKCLYDVKHQDYMNIILKDSIWKRIAEALNLKDGNEAKKTWEKLRNNHRDALRRQKKTKPDSGSGAVNIKPWRFQDNMAFLIPHMTNRLTSFNVHEEISQDRSSNTTEIDMEENCMDNQEYRTGNEDANVTEPEPPTNESIDHVKKKRRKTRNTFHESLNRTIKGNQQRINRQQERERSTNNNDFTCNNLKNDALFHFFISMYETTKRLPTQSQLTIKRNIFSLVSEEEYKNLEQYSPRPHSSNTQISNAATYYSTFQKIDRPSPVQQPNESLPAESKSEQIILTQELKMEEEAGSEDMYAYSTQSFN